MQSETKKQSFMGTWSGSVAVACLALMLGFASTGYGSGDIVTIIGNFENADSCDGWGGGSNDPLAILVPDSNKGVTLGHGSLQLTPVADGAYWRLAWAGSPIDMTDARLKFDLTMVASEWGGSTWTKVGAKVAINSNGPSGWKEWGPDVPNDSITVIDRDTELATSFDWGPWSGDANKTYTVNFSEYDSTGATWMQMAISVQDGNVLDTGHFYFDNMRLITPAMRVTKSTVTAGKTQAQSVTDHSNMKDALTVSGTIDSLGFPADLNTINHVDVNIVSVDGYSVFFEANDFNYARNVNKGKFTHTYKIPKNPTGGAITSMVIDFKNNKFAITVKDANLTGLACPFAVKLTLGSDELTAYAHEMVVNGPKTTIPIRLMKTYKDTLIVTKAKAKASTRASSDSLSVTGQIAVKNIDATQPNLHALPVVINWRNADDTNSQTFTIPADNFVLKTGHSYTLKNFTPLIAPPQPTAKVSGTIDLDKCTFTLSITKADISAVSGDVKFGISFGGFNEEDNYTLP